MFARRVLPRVATPPAHFSVMTRPTSAFARACLAAAEADPTRRPRAPLDSRRCWVWCPDTIDDVSEAYDAYRNTVDRPMPWTDFLRRHYPAAFHGLPRSPRHNPLLSSVRACMDLPSGPPRRIRAPSLSPPRRRRASREPAAAAPAAASAVPAGALAAFLPPPIPPPVSPAALALPPAIRRPARQHHAAVVRSRRRVVIDLTSSP